MRLSKKDRQVNEFLFKFLDRASQMTDQEIAAEAFVPVEEVAAWRKRMAPEPVHAKVKEEPAKSQPESASVAVAVRHIRTDGGTQQRAAVSAEAVEEYAEVLRAGGKLPPVLVFEDPEMELWLVDGFHRLAAHRAAGLEHIDAHIRHGDQRAAILASVSVNTSHGVRLTNADKRRKVFTLLKDPEWSEWSNVAIAQATGTTHPFVGKLRRELEAGLKEPDETVSAPADVARWSWESDDPDERKLRVARVGSALEAAVLLQSARSPAETVAVRRQRDALEDIAGMAAPQAMAMGYRHDVAPGSQPGLWGAWVARIRELAETWPADISAGSMEELEATVTTQEHAQQVVFCPGIPEEQLYRCVQINRWIVELGLQTPYHYKGLEAQADDIRAALNVLPGGLAAVARHKLAAIEKAIEKARNPVIIPARAPTLAERARELARQADPAPQHVAAFAAELGKVFDVKDLADCANGIQVVAGASGGACRTVLEACKKRLWELDVSTEVCPDVRCKGAWYAKTEKAVCPKCYSEKKAAEKNWSHAKSELPVQLDRLLDLYERAGLELPARISKTGAMSGPKLVPVGMLRVAWVGSEIDLRNGIIDGDFSEDVVVMTGNDAGSFISMEGYDVHICMENNKEKA